MKKRMNPTSLILIAAIFSITILNANILTVGEVYSGDRFEIKGWEKVGLTGIKAPKLNEPMGKEAFEFTKKELEGKLVEINTYTTDNTAVGIVRDKEGLARVVVRYGDIGHEKKARPQSVDFNALMLIKGLARVDEAFLPEHLQYYKDLEAIARQEKVGIWK
ncbi:MAG: thermonuclease family protein [Candidatus Cloacimonadaceae bacterium]